MTNKERALELVRKTGVFRPKDLEQHGIQRAVLQRLERQGQIRRITRGLYELTDSDPTEHIDLMEICKRVPHGIVCLISALNFHNMTTQMPYEVWMAIDVKARKPKLDRERVRFVRFSGDALSFGVDTHVIQGVKVRVTSPAKTVADCFKYRNKIGTDVATEAIRSFIADRKGKRDDLWRAAEICRVTNVMQPYLVAIT